MHAIILAATYERKYDNRGREVPLPLLDLHGEPYLTTLVKKLALLSSLSRIVVVTNDVLKPQLEEWASSAPARPPIRVLGDGTRTPESRLGAVGDLMLALKADAIQDDVLVVGGDNWFAYDLQDFVSRSSKRSPAVVLTPLPEGVDATRFGIVDLDAEARVVSFVEKPAEATRLPLRASCVYYFAAGDLKWLDTFAQQHSTRCPPGQFIAWLAGRTAVYGVRLDATWYDLSGSQASRLRGPNVLEFRDELRKAVSPLNQPWQRAAAAEMQWVSSHEDLLEVLHDADPNKRIIAAHLLGGTGHLLNPEGRQVVEKGLVRLLDDKEYNQYGYASSDDEEDAIPVSEAAAGALVRLGYGRTKEEVVARSRQA